MSEIKRVGFTTLEPQKANDKSVKKYPKTVRISVVLPESTEAKCPEFNYKDDLAAAKKRNKQNKEKEPVTHHASNGLEPFDDDNDDDVKRIALEMEAKYGTGVTNDKKKRKGRKDDYADIGMGYDESDSFIDNTDGYDEIIPHNVTTARGGFYINCGALEFKTDDEASSAVSSSSSESGDSSESDSEDDKDASKAKRKRPLDTTDEESNDPNKEDKKQKLEKPSEKPNKISMAQAIKKKLFSPDKIQIKKKSKDISKENKIENRRMSADLQDNDSEKESKKEKQPMRISSVNDAINSVIGRVEVCSPLPKIAESQNSSKKGDPSPPKSDSRQNSPNDIMDLGSPKTEIPKLPENLPSDILATVESLKKEASEYKDGGKVKFFSGNVNQLLLSLERKCKILGRSSRWKVYEHLAPFVKCRKETLSKRAKNLVLQDEQRKLDRAVIKLKTHIDSVMPRLIVNYENECQKVVQRKAEASNEEQSKQIRAPKRRFQFSEETKKTVKEILMFKKRCFILEGKMKNSMEDLLLGYIKSDVLILWPEGWMSVSVLKKFCNTAALKTPDPKNINNNSTKHSEKTANISAATLSLSKANNLTIIPVNLSDKISEVGSNSSTSQKVSETVLKSVKEPSKPSPPKPQEPKLISKDNGINKFSTQSSQSAVPKPFTNSVTITSIKPSESNGKLEAKGNSLFNNNTPSSSINHTSKPTPKSSQPTNLTNKPKEIMKPNPPNPTVKTSPNEEAKRANDNTVILSKSTTPTNHCQVIDLTDQFSPPPPAPHMLKVIERRRSTLELERDLLGSPTHGDDVQKVMESLKALQKMSSPAKVDTAPVSVIATAKTCSPSNSSSSLSNSYTGSSITGAKTDFVGAATSLGFQDEFQKQFMNNAKPSSLQSAKSNYNKCS